LHFVFMCSVNTNRLFIFNRQYLFLIMLCLFRICDLCFCLDLNVSPHSRNTNYYWLWCNAACSILKAFLQTCTVVVGFLCIIIIMIMLYNKFVTSAVQFQPQDMYMCSTSKCDVAFILVCIYYTCYMYLICKIYLQGFDFSYDWCHYDIFIFIWFWCHYTILFILIFLILLIFF
jgi:hypothetical protein